MHESAGGAVKGPRIIEPGELRSMKTYLRPTDETLWAQLQAIQDTIDAAWVVYHPHRDPHSGDRDHDCVDREACVLLQSCTENLVLARDCIVRRDRWWRAFLENIQLFWRLVHHIDENLVLLVPVPSLAARAIEVQGIVERRLSPQQQKTWLGTDGKSGADLDVESVAVVVKPETVVQLQRAAAMIDVDERIFDYAVAIVRATIQASGLNQ